VTERIVVHVEACRLDDAGSLRAFRNRWRQATDPWRSRIELHNSRDHLAKEYRFACPWAKEQPW
jgi:hypothetical protein